MAMKERGGTKQNQKEMPNVFPICIFSIRNEVKIQNFCTCKTERTLQISGKCVQITQSCLRTPPSYFVHEKQSRKINAIRRVRFDLTPQPAAADSGTVFPAQPCRFFESPEEATKSRYPRRQRGPPAALTDYVYSFSLSHLDQEAGGTYVESRASLRSAPHVYQRNQF